MLKSVVRRTQTLSRITRSHLRCRQLKLSTDRDLCPPQKKKKSGAIGIYYTLGAVGLTSAAVVTYAKYDENFRKNLVEKVPALDPILKVIYLEESLIYTAESAYSKIKHKVSKLFASTKKEHIAKIAEIKDVPPPPALLPLLDEGKNVKEKPAREARIEKKEDFEEEGQVVDIVRPKPMVNELPETDPRNLMRLEKELTERCSDAVNAYNRAIYDLQVFNVEVENVVDESVENIKADTWSAIRAKARAKEASMEEAQKKADDVISKAKKLERLVRDSQFEASDSSRSILLENIKRIERNVLDSKKELDENKKKGNVANKYWHEVRKAREHFSEQLESLFPTIDLNKRNLTIHGEDLDLFLMHAYSHVLFYQKEVAKAETVARERLQRAVDSVKKGGGEALTTAQICQAVDEEKRRITLCYQKQCLKLRKESEAFLREQLKRQSQAFMDHFEEALLQKEQEKERLLGRIYDEKLEEERCRFKMQMAAIVGRLKALDRSKRVRERSEELAKKAQNLWATCESLLKALKSYCPGLPWYSQLRPLSSELKAIEKAAAKDDPLVKSVLSTLPKEAVERGVYTEEALRERFLKVERVARMLALVPAEGAALPVYVLSFLQALLLVKAPCPIPQSELNDEVTDFSELTTNDILQRARYWMDRGNFAQTLRYMNLLSGASRQVARQWMNEAKILLEVQQAARALILHASSASLLLL